MGTHVKILSYSKAYAFIHKSHALTMGKHLWCYRAHCMQARTLKYDVDFSGANLATDVVVLVSLPLPLLISSRCGMPA